MKTEGKNLNVTLGVYFLMENMDEIPTIWGDLYDDLQNEEFQTFAGFAIFIRSLIIFPIFTFIGALITNRLIDKKVNR